ncbi:MAG: adenylate/guanylate cyclase domain-containing protein, partial [Flavisolibacter sp.]
MRRLSAIMFTDMVGYSALTQKNEALALELLGEHRQILRPIFPEHNGREIETAGDSFFVEFNSAVEATKCAIQIQKVLNERNKLIPEERHILIRIGLHIGDVVYLDEHVHGDGVNIAARMEPLAQPGGICISEDVARQVRNKISYPILKLPDEKLKNISMPMDVYCIALPWLKQDVRTKTLPVKKIVLSSVLLLLLVTTATYFYYQDKNPPKTESTSKFRLAVLPLANISNDSTNEYFADGMTEELISTLSKIGGLNVIARTSVMKYKKTNKDITQIGKELMAGTILEGTVRRFENKAKINVNLVNVSSQERIWTKDYEKELKDIFMIQSEIAADVADELKVRVDAAEKAQLDKNMTADMQAFEDYLIGKHLLNQRTSESIQNAITYFEKSIQQDRNFALAYASLAYAYTLVGVAGYGNIPREVAEAKARESVMKALEIDETLAEAHAALGYIKFRIDWDWDGAEKELKRAIQIKPSYATAHEWYALFLAIKGRLD